MPAPQARARKAARQAERTENFVGEVNAAAEAARNVIIARWRFATAHVAELRMRDAAHVAQVAAAQARLKTKAHELAAAKLNDSMAALKAAMRHVKFVQTLPPPQLNVSDVADFVVANREELAHAAAGEEGSAGAAAAEPAGEAETTEAEAEAAEATAAAAAAAAAAAKPAETDKEEEEEEEEREEERVGGWIRLS